MTFLEAIGSKYGPVRGVGRGSEAPRIALSAEPAGGAVADAFAGALPSSRWADDTVDNEILNDIIQINITGESYTNRPSL